MTLDEYVKLPYRVVYRDEGAFGWSARLPELPGCVAAADSREELDALIEDAKQAWIENALHYGDPVPLPESPPAYVAPRRPVARR
ncbi:MAG TPA: type II toxin-antitoxin system HicB family antitoxin [Chloroflexota bacterium]|jgi:predicted RNase H-like HicB family nuclease